MNQMNTEVTHKLILDNLSPERILRLREEMERIHSSGLKELLQLYTSLRVSQPLTYDGVLIRTLMDVGYVSLYSAHGYLGISLMIPIESLHEATNEKDLERKIDSNYEEYLADREKQDHV